MSTLSERLNEVAKIAVKLEEETLVPAKLIITQWAIESRWGAKPVGNFNFFGMKRAARHTKFSTTLTREVIGNKSVMQKLEFADYDSLEESCRDYTWLISNGRPYAPAWQRYLRDRDINALIVGIAAAYATDPGYASLMKAVSIQTNVNNAILASKLELHPATTIQNQP